MSSLRLTHQLQQKMVLTPQLRQRIEMLQMTSLELSELVEQEMVANPILEEVQPGDEMQEIADNILDQNSDGQDADFENGNDPTSDTMIEIRTPASPSSGVVPASADGASCIRRWRLVFSPTEPR